MVGEHIRALKRGRWNHAIDCGDETVIHLAEDGATPLAVRRSYRPEFVSGAEAVEVVTHRERTFPANEVVARAYSRIGDPGLAAMFRSSESFAAWCTTGRSAPAPEAGSAGLAELRATGVPPEPTGGNRGAAARAAPKRAKPARTAKRATRAAKPGRRPGGRGSGRGAKAKAPPRAKRAAKAAPGRAKPRKPERKRR